MTREFPFYYTTKLGDRTETKHITVGTIPIIDINSFYDCKGHTGPEPLLTI